MVADFLVHLLSCSDENGFHNMGDEARTITSVMLSEERASEMAGVFPRGLGQVSKLRKQIKAYVNGQLDACMQPDPEHPKAHFKVSHCPFSLCCAAF